jgi:hypothetical protein
MGLRTLKDSADTADTQSMTTVNPVIRAWAAGPTGRATRIAIAVVGMASATLVLMSAAVVTSASWALILLGVGMATASVRAALSPTLGRLAITAIAMSAVPFVVQSL